MREGIECETVNSLVEISDDKHEKPTPEPMEGTDDDKNQSEEHKMDLAEEEFSKMIQEPMDFSYESSDEQGWAGSGFTTRSRFSRNIHKNKSMVVKFNFKSSRTK